MVGFDVLILLAFIGGLCGIVLVVVGGAEFY